MVIIVAAGGGDFARAEGGEKVVYCACFCDGERAADEEAGVIIRTAGEAFDPRCAGRGLKTVFALELLDVGRGEVLQNRGPGDVAMARTRTVDGFKVVEEQDEFFEMVDGQFVVDGVRSVSDGMGDVAFVDIRAEAVNVVTQLLNFYKLVFGDAVQQHMNFAAIFGEVGSCFDADERVLGMSRVEFECAADVVVVGEGDEVHAESLSCLVDELGVGVGLIGAEALEEPL